MVEHVDALPRSEDADNLSDDFPTNTMPYVISASAGTGKTTQLLQDILLDLLNRNADEAHSSIRESLIITFTVAAAAEIRRRLEQNLQYAILYARRNHGCQPGSLVLLDTDYQLGGDDSELARTILHDCHHAQTVFSVALNDLPTVQISTIDALSKRIVDRNADTLPVAPGFQILADDAMKNRLRGQTLDALFESWYDERNSMHARFMDVLDNMQGPRHDGDLRATMMSLYDKALTKPNRIGWLSRLAEPYRFNIASLNQVVGGEYGNEYLDRYFRGWIDMAEHPLAELRSCLDEALASCHDAHTAQQDTVVKSLRMICDLPQYLRSESWNAVRARVIDANPLDVLPKRITVGKTAILKSTAIAVPKDSELGRRLAETVRGIKGIVSDLQSKLAFTAEQVDSLDEVAARRLEGLIALITTFDQQYALVKQQESVAEFSDVAFWALDAMQQPDVAKRIGAQWRYIYVDECQDNNALQNRFIREISRNAAKLTMVGDVKQSIYGFRDASPEEFGDICNSVTDASHRRELWVNYRSVPEIITFVNTVFARLMTPNMGATDYLKEQLQIGSAKQAGKPFDAEAIELLVSNAAPDLSADVVADENGTDTAPTVRAGKDELQVDMIVRRVQELCEGPRAQYSYGDIAVLARGATHFADLADRLYRVGIPVEVQGVGDLYRQPEIQIALDWLRIIANRHQDVPLVAVLRTMGFTDDDLARIRLHNRGWLFDVMRRIAESGGEADESAVLSSDVLLAKISAFLRIYDAACDYARVHSLSDSLWHLYAVSGLFDFAGNMPEGERRQANLRLLVEKADAFAVAQERGLQPFLDAVTMWSASGSGEEASTVPTKNAVHIMTIHKSKGLQWPVVILMGASNNLLTGSRTAVVRTIAHQTRNEDGAVAEYGEGALSLVDQRNHVRVDTFQRAVIDSRAKELEAAEELRLLYVAMTRAERKLIIAGSYRPGKNDDGNLNLRTMAQGISLSGDGRTIDPRTVVKNSGSPNYLYWILGSLLASGDADDDSSAILRPNEVRAWNLAAGLQETAPAMAATGRAITIRFCSAAPEPTTTMNERTDGYGYINKRIDVTGLRLPDEPPRMPVVVSSSKARSWMIDDAESISDDTDSLAVLPSDDAAAPIAMLEDNLDDWKQRREAHSGFFIPDFMKKVSDVEPSASEVGTAVHNVLELFDWGTEPFREQCEAELRNIVDCLEANHVITPQVAHIVLTRELEGLLWFVTGENCPLSAQIRAHRDTLFREEPFSMLIERNRLNAKVNGSGMAGGVPNTKNDSGNVAEQCDDTIVVRGIIDGYFLDPTAKTITLFDYKTDKMRPGETVKDWSQRLRTEYAQQQALYAEALEHRYSGYAVVRRWLVGLIGHRIIHIS